jgi:hypothetical protein
MYKMETGHPFEETTHLESPRKPPTPNDKTESHHIDKPVTPEKFVPSVRFDEQSIAVDDIPELNTRQILQNMSSKLNEHLEKEYNRPMDETSLIEQVFGPNQSCLVKLKAETLEFISGIETPNKYDVFLPNGLRLLAIEESTFFNRVFLGAQRSFIMRICFASNKVELLKIERPFHWFHQELIVSDTSRKGALLGKIQRGTSWFRKEFEIWDDKKLIYLISSPLLTFWTFDIYDMNGNQVGVIKKKWAGLLKEFYDDSDNFVIQYPKKCTSAHKSLILSTTFLLEFMYFDNAQKTNA